MPFLRREVIQRDDYFTLKSYTGSMQKLLAADFASKAPKDLANTIISMCSYLERVTKVIISSIHWGSSSDDEKKL